MRQMIAGILACAGMSALTAPAIAQDAAPPEDSTIVVTGEVEREVDERAVRSQARAITPRGSTIDQPLARFQQPVCAGVWGLASESAQLVIDRIYYNAEAAGMKLDETEGCAANVIVAFVADPHAEFQDMRDADHPLVSGLDFWERKRVADAQGAVVAWNAVTTRTNGGELRSGNPPSYETTQMSRLGSATRRDIEVSVMLVATSALANLDGVSVADYATMRMLARTLPPRDDEPAYGTILSLFSNPENAPERMTEFDRAYLTSLYSGLDNTPARMALRNVGDIMDRGVEGMD